MDESPRVTRRGALRAGATLATSLPAVAGRVRGHDASGASAPESGTGGRGAPEGYAPLGSVAIDGAKEAVVAGEYAFVAATDGFVVVDVSDPADPTVVVERRNLLPDRENGPLQAVWDVKVEGDRLLVAGPANPSREDLRAAVLYDVSDPADPEEIAVRETDFFHHNAFLREGRVYLTGNDGEGNPLVILDDELEELGRWSLADADEAWLSVHPSLKPLHDLWVRDGVAYLSYWDAGTWLVDVRDPATPEALATVRGRPPERFEGWSGRRASNEAIRPPGNDHYPATNDDGTLLGVGQESWGPEADSEEGPGGIELFDLTGERPRSITTVAPPPTPNPSYGGTWTTAHNFELTGDRLYSSWYQGGVRVYDLADPASPRLVRAWRADATTSFWTARLVPGRRFFVASSHLNPSDPSGPGRLFTFPDPPADAATVSPPGIDTSTPTPTTTTVRSTTTTTTDGRTTTTASTTSSGTGPETGTGPTTRTTTASRTDEETDTDGTGAGGPGPGVVGTVGALALGTGAWLYRRGAGVDEAAEDGEE